MLMRSAVVWICFNPLTTLPCCCLVDTGVTGKRVHKETLSPLDATIYKGKERPGMHTTLSLSGEALAGSRAPTVVDPKGGSAPRKAWNARHRTAGDSTDPLHPPASIPNADFLPRHSGLGGTISREVAKEAEEKRKAGAGSLASPPKAGAKEKRPNPPNSELRRYYERSDLPVVILQ
jgi:hypothetical protein